MAAVIASWLRLAAAGARGPVGGHRGVGRPAPGRGRRCCRCRRSGPTSRSGGSSTPPSWGQGYAAEAGHAVAHHAFDAGVEELFAVVRPRNTRGARTATSIGMEWVGETEKYYDLRLQVYRLRKGELDVPRLPGA